MTKPKPRHAFDPASFLSNNWQQKPVLLRGFIDNFEDPISAEELAGLACEDEVESRLITVQPNGDRALEHGPFPEQRFLSLPDTAWTVLVQAVDQHWPEVRKLLKQFDFIPNWRLDDVMVSYATRDGGVGAHFDYYDVFLLQGSGRRRWTLGQHCDDSTPVQDVAGQSLLRDFKTTAKYELKAGDCLYVPARVAHRGTTVDAGLCYSIGFRAPSSAELIEGITDLLLRRSGSEQRYSDPKDMNFRDLAPGEIPASALRELATSLRQALGDDSVLLQAFGQAVTYPKYPELLPIPDPPLQRTTLDEDMARGATLRTHPGSRFAYTRRPDASGLFLFVDAGCFTLSGDEVNLATDLCASGGGLLKKSDYESLSEQGRQAVLALLNQGSLELLQNLP